MKSLQVDCVGQMPDTPTRDDPFSLHSSQGISANGVGLVGPFSACKVSQPVEDALDSTDRGIDEDEHVRRKLAEELKYHKTGSRLVASMAAGNLDEMRKERSKRVSNEAVFWSSHRAVTAGQPASKKPAFGSLYHPVTAVQPASNEPAFGSFHPAVTTGQPAYKKPTFGSSHPPVTTGQPASKKPTFGSLYHLVTARQPASNEPAFGSFHPAVTTGQPAYKKHVFGSSHPPEATGQPASKKPTFRSLYHLVTARQPASNEPAFGSFHPAVTTGQPAYKKHVFGSSHPPVTTRQLASKKPTFGSFYPESGSGAQSEPGPYTGNYISQIEQSSLKTIGQDGQHSICLFQAGSVQIGNNNTMHVGKKVSNKENLKDFKPPKQTANALHLQSLALDDRPVTESHLDLLRGELGKDWKHCARKLGFREPEIDEIDHDYERYGLKEKVFQMLHKWQMKEGCKGATVGKLAVALVRCRRSNLTLNLHKCS
ncbi:uncharacterized protein LOC144601684 [Rhinoraja longicauda]